MASQTIAAFYLGVFSDLDPNESNYQPENSASLLGMTFGSPTDPLYASIDSLTLTDTDNDGAVRENDNGQTGEPLTYDGVSSALDSVIDYYVTVTYTDGTTATTMMEVFQDESGRLFLSPFNAGSSYNDVLNDKPITSITLDSIAGDNFIGTSNNLEENAFITCYAPGTLIDTPDGPRAVESLRVGDLVNTLGHGPQPIRWTRRNDQPLEKADVDAKPVLIAAGALGKGLPTQDLVVSPQHRMFVGGGGQLDGWFRTEAFAPAKSLTALQGIRHMKGKTQVTWIHFACDRHEVVTANGCLSESLLLGSMVVNGLSSAERRALIAIYGPAATPDAALNGPAARECLKVGEVRRLLESCRKDKQQRTAAEFRKWDVDLAMERWEADRLKTRSSKTQRSDIRLAS